MNNNNVIKDIIYFCLFIGSVIIITYIIDTFIRPSKNITSPVEGCEIDSLTTENEILIIKIDNLDSIKNAKIIEVQALDNDSTLKLFYELISK